MRQCLESMLSMRSRLLLDHSLPGCSTASLCWRPLFAGCLLVADGAISKQKLILWLFCACRRLEGHAQLQVNAMEAVHTRHLTSSSCAQHCPASTAMTGERVTMNTCAGAQQSQQSITWFCADIRMPKCRHGAQASTLAEANVAC